MPPPPAPHPLLNPRVLRDPRPQELAPLDEQCFSPSWSLQDYGQLLSSPAVSAWILTGDKGGWGFLCWQQVREEAELYRIGIVPAHRGQGLGLWAMQYWQTDLRTRGVRRVVLEVRAGNAPAIALYERAGYSPLAIRKAYYHDPREDALSFELRL
ncbi:MAG: GNAT family N-acetyltransferase, partial [Deltaproteobacteria bacterium]|nr:GNAT family N-acetyltransferase [Deltaproteobacteria bacterium]